MGVAVGQCQGSNAVGVACGEDLADPAAAVVADEVDLVDVQRVEYFGEHVGVGGDRHVLFRGDFGVAVGEQIHGDAASDVGQGV